MKIELKSYVESQALIHFSLVSVYQQMIAERQGTSVNVVAQQHNKMADHLLCLQKSEYIIQDRFRMNIAECIRNGERIAAFYDSLAFPNPYDPVAPTSTSAIYVWQLVNCLEEIQVKIKFIFSHS